MAATRTGPDVVGDEPPRPALSRWLIVAAGLVVVAGAIAVSRTGGGPQERSPSTSPSGSPTTSPLAQYTLVVGGADPVVVDLGTGEVSSVAGLAQLPGATVTSLVPLRGGTAGVVTPPGATSGVGQVFFLPSRETDAEVTGGDATYVAPGEFDRGYWAALVGPGGTTAEIRGRSGLRASQEARLAAGWTIRAGVARGVLVEVAEPTGSRFEIWDPFARRTLRPLTGAVRAAATPTALAWTTRQRRLHLADLRANVERSAALPSEFAPPVTIAVAPDNRTVALVVSGPQQQRVVLVVDVAAARVQRVLADRDRQPTHVAWAGNGSLLIVHRGPAGTRLSAWRSDSGRVVDVPGVLPNGDYPVALV